MSTITKNILAKKITDDFGFSKNYSQKFVTSIFKEMSDIILKDLKITIPNLGNFTIFSKKARPGMNIDKMTKIVIGPRKVIRFVPSRIIKEKVNEGNKILHNK